MIQQADAVQAQSLRRVLEAEFRHLYRRRPRRLPPTADEACRLAALRRELHELPADQAPTALCLSGGGVRSATFALGVLQALARRGLLHRFHYLSTVSGGGYVGGFVSSWIARQREQAVQQPLADVLAAGLRAPCPGDDSRSSADSEPVRRLRACSRYLAPLGGLSGDTLALVSTFLRNLVLHWCVVVPLLMALLMLPRVHASLLQWAAPPWVMGGAFTLALLAIGAAIAYIAADLPSWPPPQQQPRNRFALGFALPMMLSALLLSWVGAWATPTLPYATQAQVQRLLGAPAWAFAASGAVLHLAAAAIGSTLRGFRGLPRRSSPSLLREGLAVLGSGAAGGALLHVALTQLEQQRNAATAVEGWLPAYAVLAVPTLLALFWQAVTLYAGFTRPIKSEDDREWWARAGGYGLGLAAAWLLLNTLVLAAPAALLRLPAVDQLLGPASLGAGALGMGVLTGAWGYWSKQGAAIGERVSRLAQRLELRVLDLLALAFLLLLAVLGSLALSSLIGVPGADPAPPQALRWAERLAQQHEASLRSTPAGLAIVLALGAAAAGAVAALWVGVNTFSLHSLYGNRLIRAYLGATRRQRRPHAFTGFDPSDNLRLSRLAQPGPGGDAPRRLFHVVNAALNLVAPSGDRPEWQQRKAASFTFSPLHCGSPATGYAPTAQYGGRAWGPGSVERASGVSLGRAMAISGAAAAPNMGYHSSRPVALVMSLFNLRLGWWMPNPGCRHRRHWRLQEPAASLWHVVAEAIGRTTADSASVYLSDGGHFENLGLYEMVRRRCRLIVLVDATQDPGYQYADLEASLRRIRIDLGIGISFPRGLPRPDSARSTGQHVAVGLVHYRDADTVVPLAPVADGTLVLVKPVLSGDEPLDLRNYAERSRGPRGNAPAPFPHQSTADQFFDEAQFEAYRALGEHSLERALGSRNDWAGLVAPDHRVPPPAAAAPVPPAAAATTAQNKTKP